jgi:hypothetical protein
MFWSPGKSERMVSVVDDCAAYLSKNGNGHHASVAAGREDVGREEPLPASRRQSTGVLIPMMVGSQMILAPRSEHGVGLDWPRSIPAKE